MKKALILTDAKVIRGIASESNGYMHQVPLLLLVVTLLLMPGGGDEPTLHTPAQIGKALHT